jgi:PAS domain S-box-containing protein
MMESLLLQSKQDWEETFNTIEEMITIHDREFNIIRANRAAEENLDLLSHRGNNGKKCYTYYHGKDAPPSSCPSCNCLKTGESASFEIFEPHFNKHFEINVIPRFDKNNALTGLIHVSRDISRRKKSEEELKKHRERLSDLVQERTSALTASNRLLSLEISERKQVEMALRMSESKYRDLYNNAPDMYYSINKDKIIIDCNDTEAKMLGYRKDEIIGRPLANFLSDESTKYLEDDYLKLKEHKVLKNRERYFVRKGGSLFPAIINVFAEVDEQGEIVTAHAIARDITGLKKTERELRNVNRSLKVLSDFNNALIHVTEESELLNEICRIILETGEYSLAWVGFLDDNESSTIYPAAQAGLDIKCSQTISIGEDSACLISRTVLQGRTHLSRQTTGDPFIHCCKSIISMSTLSSAVYIPLQGEKGVLGILCIYARETDAFDPEELDLLEKLAANLSFGIGAIRSNIERKRAEAETLRASHLASLGELAAGVAHEINNPINGIINYAQILSNKYIDGAKEQEITDRIIKEGDRIANIVRSLLSFARDRKEGKREVSIKEIMADSLALTDAQLKKDGIHLIMKIPSDLPKITAQAQQLEQVFLNLISNARYALNQKYHQGNKNKIFEVTAEHIVKESESALRLIFRDRGTGIPSHISNKIIDPFFSTKPTSVGTGLGLSISHGIISNHHGRINIESVEGEYTSVIIELPVPLQEKENV